MAITCKTSAPGSPAVPATPSRLLTDFNLGWNASAQSIGALPASGRFDFTVGAASLGVVAGLTSTPSSLGYNSIQYGLYSNKGKVCVMEGGVVKSSLVSAPDAVLSIRRMGVFVDYLVNGTPIYTSTVPSADILTASAFLYSAGDTVTSPAIIGLVVGYAELEPLASRGGVGLSNIGYALLEPLEARNTRQGGTNYLQPLSIFAGAGSYSASANFFEPLVTRVESGQVIPTYALSAAALPYFHTVAHGITDEVGTSTAYLSPLSSLSADHAYGISVNEFYPLVTLAGAAWPVDGYLIATLPGGYTVASSGYGGAPSGVSATLPAVTVQAFSGASVRLTLPKLALGASGTVTVVGRVNTTLPALTLIANGKAGGVSTVYAQHGGRYSVVASTGAQAILAHGGRYAASSEGRVGGVATAAFTLASRHTITAAGTADVYAVADMVLPPLQAAPSGQAWLVGPSLTMHASGGEVVAATYEAYAINLTTGSVTHYTNYPFDNILRFGNHYYGVKSDGVYELGGVLDVDIPIDAHIKTFQTPFGTKNQKRVPYVYASGRSDQGVVVGVTADEGTTYEYESAWGEVAGTANHRVKVGNGIRGVYYSFDVKNVDGGSLELDEISVHVAPTTRAV